MIPQPLNEQVEQMLARKVAEWRSRFSTATQPRLAQLLLDGSAVQIRKAMGQDVSLAEQALLTAMAQLPLEERERARQAAGELAFEAAIVLISRLVGGG